MACPLHQHARSRLYRALAPENRCAHTTPHYTRAAAAHRRKLRPRQHRATTRTNAACRHKRCGGQPAGPLRTMAQRPTPAVRPGGRRAAGANARSTRARFIRARFIRARPALLPASEPGNQHHRDRPARCTSGPYAHPPSPGQATQEIRPRPARFVGGRAPAPVPHWPSTQSRHQVPGTRPGNSHNYQHA